MQPEELTAVMARFRMNWPRTPNDALDGWAAFFDQWDVRDVTAGIGSVLEDEYFRKHDPRETDFRKRIEAAARNRFGLGAVNPNRPPEEACAMCGGYGMVSVPGYRDQETRRFVVSDDIEGAIAEHHQIAIITVACRCSVGRYYGGETDPLADEAHLWLNDARVRERAGRYMADWVTGLPERLGVLGEVLMEKIAASEGDVPLATELRKYAASVASESTRRWDEINGASPQCNPRARTCGGNGPAVSLGDALAAKRGAAVLEVAGLAEHVQTKAAELEAGSDAEPDDSAEPEATAAMRERWE